MTIENAYERPEGYEPPQNGAELLARYANGERYFVGADLRFADLRTADLRNADLRDADLRDADLRTADLRNADFRDADLHDTDLRYADLRDADLRYTNLRGANWRGAEINWLSHEVVAELLRQSAETVGQEMVAFFVGAKTEWCWDEFLACEELQSSLVWAAFVLRGYVKDGDGAPAWLTDGGKRRGKRGAR